MLNILTGLPGSGKTTYALAWVAADPDLRAMLFNAHGLLSDAQEGAVTAAEQSAVANLLGIGMDVIVDATNSTEHDRAAWADLAATMGHAFNLHVVDTPVAECIRRDAARGAAGGRTVGADVITLLDHLRSA